MRTEREGNVSVWNPKTMYGCLTPERSGGTKRSNASNHENGEIVSFSCGEAADSRRVRFVAAVVWTRLGSGLSVRRWNSRGLRRSGMVTSTPAALVYGDSAIASDRTISGGLGSVGGSSTPCNVRDV